LGVVQADTYFQEARKKPTQRLNDRVGHRIRALPC
jgi:hypothetical protein